MPSGARCAEIGVWKGDFSHAILEVARPRVLHLVDPWRFSQAESATQSTWHSGNDLNGQRTLDDVFQGVAERFAGEIASGQVVIHRVPSVEAVAAFGEASLDWVYIDGNHFYDAVRQDLALWQRVVRPGGIIAGDDYRESEVFGTDVVRAVDEFALERNLDVESWGRQYLIRLRE
jgi:hypothetical protein